MKRDFFGLSILNQSMLLSVKRAFITLKMRFALAAVIIGTLTCLSGCLNDSAGVSANGSVTGKITDKSTGAPLAGVNVKLIDNKFKPSGTTVTLGGNQAAAVISQPYFISAAATGSDGVYMMSGLPDGDYSVVPGDISEISTAAYEIAGGTQSYSISLRKGGSAVVDFVKAVQAAADISPSEFQVNITWQNMPSGPFFVTAYRRNMALFIPFFGDKPCTQDEFYCYNGQTSSFTFNYGATNLFYTVENVFIFKIKYNTGNWVYYGDGGGYTREEKTVDTPPIFLPLSGAPWKSYFVYDFAANTMKQTK
ncbi:MAG: hypothetical protein BWY32_02941 [bacterium ADurb.Bin243]|nr:MAG: hypothetical protein BWY32_02941 [bacterium ADurb.Bin243]